MRGCHVISLDMDGHERLGTSRFLDSIHKEMTLGLASGFQLSERRVIAASSTSYQPGAKWRECLYPDNNHLRFRWLPSTIQSNLGPLKWNGSLASRCDIDSDIWDESSSPTSGVFEDGASSIIASAGVALAEKGLENNTVIAGGTLSS